ncbi:DUF167 domain-containing protein [Candidatus Uhrbacteria bacterium]|nr:DUF167 domain-containing protein [Candidatus Uhrbacteria bacterium]
MVEKRVHQMKFRVSVIPNAKQSELVGKIDGIWKIRLKAPPIEGKANEELIRFLAEKLDCAPSEIEIEKGLGSKLKTISVPDRIRPDAMDGIV